MSQLKFKYSYQFKDYNISSNKVPVEIIKQMEKEFNEQYGQCSDLINKHGGFIQIRILNDFTYDKEASGLTGILPENYSKELEECLKN